MIFLTVKPKPYIKLKILATLMDYGIYLIFYIVYLCIFDENPEPGEATVTGIMFIPVVIVWFIYFVVIESITQATPGHDIVNLKVVTDAGTKPSFSSILKRRLLDPFDIFMYGIPGIICISKTPKHQRLGDLWANTLVVKTTDITEKEVIF
jgi:uncharacterized RDD family membrane protein YckC